MLLRNRFILDITFIVYDVNTECSSSFKEILKFERLVP